MTLSFKLLNTFSSALPAPVLCFSHLRGSWSAKVFQTELFFSPVLSISGLPLHGRYPSYC